MSTASLASEAAEAPPRALRTYDELVATLPETNRPCELWDGELVMAPAPFFPHQKIALRLWRKLDDWVSERDLGEALASPIDMVLSPHRAVQPEVAFVAKANLGILRNAMRGPADLVAEVISPGGRQRDRIDKKDLYEQYAVKEYWIVDPEAHTVEVLALGADKQYRLAGRWGAGETAQSRLLPGFAVDVDWLLLMSH
ncbi:MAG: Uma2 family endonuclease [Verrucomicrobia bacterium]|nr:Uma2 family endonuclease [Verrucomicrobiota bacterium]